MRILPNITILLLMLSFGYMAFAQQQVFVDVERLAARHPAWQLAMRLRQETAKRETLSSSVASVSLTDVPLSFPSPNFYSLAAWEKERWTALQREIAALQQQVVANLQDQQILLPKPMLPPRIVDPTEQWRFVTQRLQEQAVERARLRLRLAFADQLSLALSLAEREQLQQRLLELDAQLQPSPLPEVPPLPLPPPVPKSPPSLTVKGLTDGKQIADLVAPPSPSPPTVMEWRLSFGTFPKMEGAFAATLQQMAREMAHAFAQAHGRRQNVVVVFTPSPHLPDATDDFLAAWKRWLSSTWGE